MRKNKLSPLITFFAGMIIGITILSAISWKAADIAPLMSPVTAKVSLQEAQAFTSRYSQQAIPINAVLKGFAVNREQLDAMNRLAAENSSLAGFRIYMGMDNNSQPASIVVGISNSGSDNAVSIYKTASMYSGPCPTICDESSNITTK